MRSTLRPAIVLTLVLCGITGALYPAAVTGLASLLFPRQAAGSLVSRQGRTIGSELIGQQFTGAGYFHGRPSAAGSGYDASASAGRNKGPTDRKLADSLMPAAIDSAVQLDAAARGQIPADLVTSSASGLDPHISPASAELQVARVAGARGLDEAAVREIVARHTQGRTLGFLGDPRVHVLRVNLALDSVAQVPAAGGGAR